MAHEVDANIKIQEFCPHLYFLLEMALSIRAPLYEGGKTCYQYLCSWLAQSKRNMNFVVTGCFWMPQKDNLWPFVYNQKGCQNLQTVPNQNDLFSFKDNLEIVLLGTFCLPHKLPSVYLFIVFKNAFMCFVSL